MNVEKLIMRMEEMACLAVNKMMCMTRLEMQRILDCPAAAAVDKFSFGTSCWFPKSK